MNANAPLAQAKVWNQKGGSRGGSDWNRFCGDMYSSYASGEVRAEPLQQPLCLSSQ